MTEDSQKRKRAVGPSCASDWQMVVRCGANEHYGEEPGMGSVSGAAMEAEEPMRADDAVSYLIWAGPERPNGPNGPWMPQRASGAVSCWS